MPSRRDNVDLTYTDEGGLRGLFAGESVEVPVDLPVSAGSTSGTYGDGSISAAWTIASNYNAAEQPASIQGVFLGEEFELTTTFMLLSPSNPTFVGATIAGAIAGAPVAVTISPAADSSSTVAAAGRAGRQNIDVVASVDWSTSTIRGTVDDQPVALTAKRSTPDWDSEIRIRGQWNENPSLGLLAATCLLYFM